VKYIVRYFEIWNEGNICDWLKNSHVFSLTRKIGGR
jgi:hypothetical protein